MGNISVSNAQTIAGKTISGNASIAADNEVSSTETIPVGIAGTLSTRTSDTAGVLTVESGHGYESADEISIASASAFSYDGVVDSVAATTITFSSADGDVLPLVDAAIIASQPTEIDITFSGTALVALAASCTQRALFTLENSSTVDLAQEVQANGLPYAWNTSMGFTNPVTGDAIVKANVYNGSVTAATFSMVAAYNNA